MARLRGCAAVLVVYVDELAVVGVDELVSTSAIDAVGSAIYAGVSISAIFLTDGVRLEDNKQL